MNFHMRLIAAVVGAVLASARSSSAQQKKCPITADLKNLGPDAYQLRGARCEGILAKPAGGDLIRVIGLTGAVEDFNPRLGADLHVTWRSFSGDSMWLRAVGIRSRFFYQMDASIPRSDAEFHWPVSVLLGENVRQKDVAVRGWTMESFGGSLDTVLIPVTIWQQQAPPASSTDYMLTAMPTQRLRALRWGIARTDSLGRSAGWVREMSAVAGNDFMEGTAVHIPFAQTLSPGLYRVHFAGDLWSANVASAASNSTATATALVRISRQ